MRIYIYDKKELEKYGAEDILEEVMHDIEKCLKRVKEENKVLYVNIKIKNC